MKFSNRIFSIGSAMLFLVAFQVSAESDWKEYKAEKWGFEMSVPEGTKCKDKKEGAWGGLHCKYEGVHLAAVSRDGVYTNQKIVKWAVKHLGVQKKYWSKIDEGKDSKGWVWYKVYKAQKGNRLWLAGTGTGKTKSYLIFLKTTVSDFEENESAYQKWYASVKLTK